MDFKTVKARIQKRNRNFKRANLLLDRVRGLLAENDKLISWEEELRYRTALAWKPPKRPKKRVKKKISRGVK